MSGGPTALRRLLEESAAELSQLRSSHIFTAPSGGKRTAVATAAAPGEEREQSEAAPSYHELKDENEALRREVEALKAAFEEANERASSVVRTMRKQDDIRLTLLTAAHDEAMRARDEARVDAAELRMRLEEAKTEMAGLRSRATLHELEAAAEAFSGAHQQPPAPPDEAAAATAAAGAAEASRRRKRTTATMTSAAVPPEPSSRVGADAVRKSCRRRRAASGTADGHPARRERREPDLARVERRDQRGGRAAHQAGAAGGERVGELRGAAGGARGAQAAFRPAAAAARPRAPRRG